MIWLKSHSIWAPFLALPLCVINLHLKKGVIHLTRQTLSSLRTGPLYFILHLCYLAAICWKSALDTGFVARPPASGPGSGGGPCHPRSFPSAGSTSPWAGGGVSSPGLCRSPGNWGAAVLHGAGGSRGRRWGATFATPWAVAHQAPQSMEFSRQEYWSGLPFSSPGDLPNPGIEPETPTQQADTLTAWTTREALCIFQFSSVAQSCPPLCDPMNHSAPGLPVHHELLEFTQTHVHRVSDAIQPSHPLSSRSPPAPNPSRRQSLFQWVNSSHEVAKVLEFQL